MIIIPIADIILADVYCSQWFLSNVVVGTASIGNVYNYNRGFCFGNS